ncbi:MAG: HPP family protein [Candidatus Micrarchaeia archaeon]
MAKASSISKSKGTAKRLRARLLPALLASLTLAILIALLVYFNIDKAYGIGTSAVIFTSFASSIFIMFITPSSRAAKPRRFVMSYLLAGIIGYIGSMALPLMALFVVAGLVMFFLIIAMIIIDSEHAPAAAIAFAFVLFRVGILGIIIIASAVAIILAIRFVLEAMIFRFETHREAGRRNRRRQKQGKEGFLILE